MSRITKRMLAFLLSLAMVLTGPMSGLTVRAEGEETSAAGTGLEMEDIDPYMLGVHKLGEDDSEEADPSGLEPDTSLSERVRVSIFLDAPGALDAGYSAKGISSNSEAGAYRQTLRMQQTAVTAAIEQALGYSIDVKWNLTLLTNAISCWVIAKDIPMIQRMAGVKSVEKEMLYTLDDVEEAAPNTAGTSEFMVGAQTAWTAGYTGAGRRIAIIDTGIDTDHMSFAEEPFLYAIEEVKADGKEVELMEEIPDGLNGPGVRVSAKIPFAYNYVDENTDVTHLNDTQENHGSHVAGIAGANRYVKDGEEFVDAADAVRAVGMAPDAQLLVMKVFGRGGGAYDADYMAAIEDAIVLEADAANLSLGSSVQGWTYAGTYQETFNELADGTKNPEMVVSISAGNAGPFTTYAELPYGLLYLDDVNMHTGGSPGTFLNSLCVASADNTYSYGCPFIFNGDMKVFYNESLEGDGGAYTNPPMVTVGGTYDYVYIDSLGYPEDYAAVNAEIPLEGKLVIVNRGDITFSEKGNNAAPYNPVAAVVANNQPGVFGMLLDDYTGTFPFVTITLADAEALKETSESTAVDGINVFTGSVEVTAEEIDMVSPREDAIMSSFSSWGVPGSLVMKPEITAPGGNIYSVYGAARASSGMIGGNDQYTNFSGTSMAAPHIAGLSAVMGQYMAENDFAEKNAELAANYSQRAIIQSLLMSTATPMINDDAFVSILQQGAGLADVSAAVNASSVIMMEDAYLTTYTGAAADGKVKAELGDDPWHEGYYEYSFTIYNTADIDLGFDLDTYIFTQAPTTDGVDFFMLEETALLEADFYYDYEEEPVEHDVNLDGESDVSDAQAILDYLAGIDDGSELDLEAAEMDDDGVLSTYDAYLLLDYTADAPEGVVVKAGGSKTVTVSILLGEEDMAFMDAYFEGGAYIEGFTYVTCTTSDKEGVSYEHEHSIPILAFYGSWTEASMFDNTSDTDVLYGTDRYPYTSNKNTNYLNIYYNGTSATFTGNPYIVEDEFPYERLAVNGGDMFGQITYSLIRAAGTTGFAVSLLDEIGGDVAEVLDVSIAGYNANSVYWDSNTGQMYNYSPKRYTVNKSAAEFGLEEGDIFRIGFYALPEYYGMLLNPDLTDEYAGMVDSASYLEFLIGFNNNIVGKGAWMGYDFTVDNTEPEIVTASLDGTDLTISVTDNQNLAYVAVMSLDGSVIYSEEAPAAGSYEVTVDASEAIENAHGYVAVFAGDYAGNEAASAVKVNDNLTEDKVFYVLTDTLNADDEYLIVNTNSVGSGTALGYSGNRITAYGVTIRAGKEMTGGSAYIESADVNATTVWKALSVEETGYKLQNGANYLKRNTRNNSLQVNSTDGDNVWNWNGENSQLSMLVGETPYYLRYSNNSFSLNTTAGSVYLFKKTVINVEVDPYTPTSVEILPASLDLYKNSTAELLATVAPLTASDRTVTWSSSDDAVATVDTNGVVTAVAAGTCVVTATANGDPTVTAECTVNVVDVDKVMNGIVWDEEGQVFFSTFNATSLPAWTKLHEDDKKLELMSAYMADPETLIAGTIDMNTQVTMLYQVDRSSYALEEFGENYVMAFGLAPSPFEGYMVYGFANYLILGNLVPEYDEEEGTYSGFPYGLSDMSYYIGDSYIAAVAARTIGSSSQYFFLDEAGTIWSTNFNTRTYTFGRPTRVVDTGIATDFLYQSLYYDGTWLYWSHTTDSDCQLIVINPNNGKVYNAGDFGEGVWPVAGLYVDGAVAPASLDEAEPLDVSAEELAALTPVATRAELMTPAVTARISEAMAGFGKHPAKAPEAVEEPAAEEAAAEEAAAEEAAAEEAAVEEAAVEEPVAEEPAAEEAGAVTEEISDGSLDYVRGNGAVSRAAGGTFVPMAVSGTPVTADDGTVTVEITEDEDVTNGFITFTFDAEVLTFVSASSDLDFKAINDSEDGTVVLAFASADAIEAGTVLATLTFQAPRKDQVVTADTAERNDSLDLAESVEIVLKGTDKNGWVKEDGQWYLYKDDEKLTGWQKDGGKWYLLDKETGAMKTGWQKDGDKWYLLGMDGAMKTGWQQSSGKWYLLGTDGAMKTGWQYSSGKWYYLGSANDGVMKTGWQLISGKWYYLGTDGARQSGWVQSSGKWYFLDEEGVMKTNCWVLDDGKWYLIGTDGAMKTGWQQVDGEWYLLATNGVMKTGWQTVANKTYYFAESGVMQSARWLQDGGKWYRLGDDGAMVTGWFEYLGSWYYMDASGVMVAGTTVTIGGKSYTFDASGKWIP